MNWTAPVHLIGHSYGGGVALRVAVERSNRIASLTLYEPAAFQGSPGAYLARSEINSLGVPASVQSVIAATGRPGASAANRTFRDTKSTGRRGVAYRSLGAVQKLPRRLGTLASWLEDGR